VGLAVLLSAVTIEAIQAFAVKDEAQLAAEVVLRAFAPQLGPSDFQGSLPPERTALFDALFRARGISDKVLRVRLWRADGRLLYSNAREPDGLRTVAADLSTPGGYQQFVQARQDVERDAPGVARFFVPIRLSGDPRTLGAFEIFYDLTFLEQRLTATRRTIWTAVPSGLLVLYASVFALVHRASRKLLKQQADLMAALLGTYHALASAIDTKDSYTGDHSTRVAELAVAVAQTMGLSPDLIEQTRIGARLHDLGKIGVPDAILMKSGPLSANELAVMRRHADAGAAILEQSPLSEQVRQIVRHTHERWDGGGYPDGLAGEAIPLLARIVAVADAYEAMTGDRPYRPGMPVQVAIRRLRAAAGSQFDPAVVELFIRHVAGPTAAPRRAADSPSTRPA
jgi:putative nucleotidyltransferase with HDIG domain